VAGVSITGSVLMGPNIYLPNTGKNGNPVKLTDGTKMPMQVPSQFQEMMYMWQDLNIMDPFL
jgi:hypothetical protein